VNQHASNGAGGDARPRQLGAAGEDDRHLCADDNSGQVRATEIFQLLGEHIARFEVRHKQDVSISGDGRFQLFHQGGFLAHRGIEGERSIENRPSNLAAVRHLAQCGRIQRRNDFGIDRLDRRHDRHLREQHTKHVGEFDRVLHDIDFVFKIGVDIDRGIGDQEGRS
jgi:hypothetical protein